MPEFEYDGWVDVDVDSFLSACSNREKQELVTTLIEDGYIKSSSLLREKTQMSAPEQLFEEALDKLHGKWNQLSKADEEMIIALVKRY